MSSQFLCEVGLFNTQEYVQPLKQHWTLLCEHRTAGTFLEISSTVRYSLFLTVLNQRNTNPVCRTQTHCMHIWNGNSIAKKISLPASVIFSLSTILGMMRSTEHDIPGNYSNYNNIPGKKRAIEGNTYGWSKHVRWFHPFPRAVWVTISIEKNNNSIQPI